MIKYVDCAAAIGSLPYDKLFTTGQTRGSGCQLWGTNEI